MRLSLVMALCLIAHSVCAVNFDVSQKGAFIVLKQEAGGSLVITSAIRISHISSVTLDKVEGDHRITIVTSLLSDSGGSAQKHYELKADDRRAVEAAFGQILELLARDEAEKSTPAKTTCLSTRTS